MTSHERTDTLGDNVRRQLVSKELPLRMPERRQKLRDPLFCPSCQSPRIRRLARLSDALVCCCDVCSTEFIVSPEVKPA
jgi:hypothetical protein